ncbi:uncharacterized protein Dvar_40540 [Desulfosarcina variabilis str. Montpellier]|uniref:hypothetical protein n=1 Tax=Desulfosarcina variabilis TaxID=2300 RepID=UPI003AFB0BCD
MEEKKPKQVSRDVLMKIKEAIDYNIMAHEAIAQTHNIPVELVNDIATGRQYVWLFRGGPTL